MITMAAAHKVSILILFFVLVIATCDDNYHILDVSASLNQALQVFSPIMDQQTASSDHLDADSSTVSLYSRSVLPHERDYKKNYTALTIDRLDRHQARVNSIHSRLGLALETPVVSAVQMGVGEYVAVVGVGKAARKYNLIIDTGSDITWLKDYQCSPSNTYRELSCESRQCTAGDGTECVDESCIFEIVYGDGSTTFGDYATENFYFGRSNSAVNLAFGCAYEADGFQGVSGLIGLGGGPQSLPSQIKATSFSYCLVNRDSTKSSTMDFNKPSPSDSITTPLLTNRRINTYRYVNLQGITVGGVKVSFSPSALQLRSDGSGGVIVDSGTTITMFVTAVYEPMRDLFATKTRNLRRAAGVSILDTCYDLSAVKKVTVPIVAFVFAGGKTVRLPSSNTLIPVDNQGTYCLAFAGTPQGPSIIGNVQQQGFRVTYNLAERSVGFSANKC